MVCARFCNHQWSSAFKSGFERGDLVFLLEAYATDFGTAHFLERGVSNMVDIPGQP